MTSIRVAFHTYTIWAGSSQMFGSILPLKMKVCALLKCQAWVYMIQFTKPKSWVSECQSYKPSCLEARCILWLRFLYCTRTCDPQSVARVLMSRDWLPLLSVYSWTAWKIKLSSNFLKYKCSPFLSTLLYKQNEWLEEAIWLFCVHSILPPTMWQPTMQLPVAKTTYMKLQ